MKKIIASLLIGMVIIAVPSSIFASDYYYSPIDFKADNYVEFGDTDYPRDQSYDMHIGADLDSASSQWVNLTIEILPSIISERSIDRFYVLANGKIIEEFYPQYQELEDGTYAYQGLYSVKPSSIHFIGTSVKFQVVAAADGVDSQTYQMAVAWTGLSETINFDALPVIDSEAIAWLEQQYYKLQEILQKLSVLDEISSKLTKLTETVENLFTPSTQALERFEQARQNLFEATPIDDIQSSMEQMSNTFEQQKQQLNNPVDETTAQIVLGEKKDWLNMGFEFYLFDLTEFKDIILTFRQLLSAIIWIEFFVFLMFYLAPKLDI